MNSPPSLRQWHGPEAPEVRTVASLHRKIPMSHYRHVYWIAKLADNVIIEARPLNNWYFTADGRLWGMVDMGEWEMPVAINLDEYVILSVKNG